MYKSQNLLPLSIMVWKLSLCASKDVSYRNGLHSSLIIAIQYCICMWYIPSSKCAVDLEVKQEQLRSARVRNSCQIPYHRYNNLLPWSRVSSSAVGHGNSSWLD